MKRITVERLTINRKEMRIRKHTQSIKFNKDEINTLKQMSNYMPYRKLAHFLDMRVIDLVKVLKNKK